MMFPNWPLSLTSSSLEPPAGYSVVCDGLCKCLAGVNWRIIKLKDAAFVFISLHHKGAGQRVK